MKFMKEPQQADYFNALQKKAVETTRMKIPLMQIEEGMHGFMAPGATIFPQGLGLGATWNTPLIQEIYSAVAEEARSVGVHQIQSLQVEPNRDPRHEETSALTVKTLICVHGLPAIVRGAQGENISAAIRLFQDWAVIPARDRSERHQPRYMEFRKNPP
jgi:beta-glucosidase